MHILSVNLGQERPFPNAKKLGKTGIFKHSHTGPVQLQPLGLSGDAVCDTKNHGGPDQAVYLYGAPDYAWWAQALGQELDPGTFGENLTVAGLESASAAAGDRLHIGAEVILEVTAPRIPCSTLAGRMGDPAFVKRFRQAERPGLYCRVLQPGTVQAGDTVRWDAFNGPRVTILELFRTYYEPRPEEATLRRHLAAPIAIRERADIEEKLQKLLNTERLM